MNRRRHARVERELRAVRAPGEAQAQQRAWPVLRSVYADRLPMRRRRSRSRLALIPAVVVGLSVLALTPAAATVHRWIEQTLAVPHVQPQLFSLPTRGRILVSGSGGTWTISADGARRRLGAAPQATWSPHGRYVALAGNDQLTAVTPTGTPVWSIARPAVAAPRWFAPDGYRVAYLSAGSLRVIAGDGTEDHLLAAAAGRVAPAWRPGHTYALAYVRNGNVIVVRDADSGREQWARRLSGPAVSLAWSADGARLLVVTARGALMYDGGGRLRARIPAGAGRWRTGAVSPDGRRVALLDDHAVSIDDVAATGAPRTVFIGAGVRQLAFSPDGTWLLVTWPAADQWVFVHASGAPRIVAASRIAEQFGANGFPSLDGWCCTLGGGAG